MLRGLLLIFWILAAAAAMGQNSRSKARLTNNSIVKDSAGNQYTENDWKALLMSGRYTVTPVQSASGGSEFQLRTLTPEEREMMLEKMPKPRESGSFRTGARFASFTATDLAGNTYNLKDLKGKVVVINFWFINCPPCRMEIPELNELVKTFETNSDVVFLGIALDSKTQLQQFLQRMPFHYNIIEDGRNLALQYKVKSFPTHVVIDPDGKVRFHTSGLAANTVYWIQKSIAGALADKAEIAQTN